MAARSPVIVRVAGRWLQGLAAIVATIGLGAGQFAVRQGRADPLTLVLMVGSFVGLAVLLFLMGRSLIAGRRWAWRSAVAVTAILLVGLLYAVLAAPQPPRQRWMAVLATVVLFAPPVVLLGTVPARRWFAR